jgi:hypothetical protein
VEQFPENHHYLEQLADDNVPDDSSPNADTETVFIPTYIDSMRIIPCLEVTVVDDEYTLTRKICVWPENVKTKKLIRSVLMS